MDVWLTFPSSLFLSLSLVVRAVYHALPLSSCWFNPPTKLSERKKSSSLLGLTNPRPNETKYRPLPYRGQNPLPRIHPISLNVGEWKKDLLPSSLTDQIWDPWPKQVHTPGLKPTLLLLPQAVSFPCFSLFSASFISLVLPTPYAQKPWARALKIRGLA